MHEDFETILQAGSAELAARTSPPPADAVRARGNQLRRRRSAAGTALAVAVAAVVGAGAFAAAGLPHHGGPPGAVATRPTTNPPSSAATGPSNPAPAVPPPGFSGSCRSLLAPSGVKDAVTAAYRQSQQGLVHIQPVKGTFYYGTCDGIGYAGARFMPASGATLGEQVGLQDYGGVEKYFIRLANGKWSYVASDGLPGSPRGCAAIPQIPPRLATLWADCLNERIIP